METELKQIDKLIRTYQDHSWALIKRFSEQEFNAIYGRWDLDTFYSLRDLLFTLLTKEKDFEKFYNRFDAPALSRGNKPVAWGPRFLPDLIQDEIWSSGDMKERAENIKKLYRKCIKLEKNFKPKEKK